MSIFRSTDPTTWDDVDGIIVNESAPAPSVAGVAANIACIIGSCKQGPINVVTEVGSIGEFQEIFGADDNQGVNKALKGKRFGRLKVIRVGGTLVGGTGAVQEEYRAALADAVTLPASAGVVFDLTIGGQSFSYTSQANDTRQDIIDGLVAALASNGKHVTASDYAGNTLVLTSDAGFENVITFGPNLNGQKTVTAQAGVGAQLVAADSDYQAAIDVAKQENTCNVLFLDSYNAARNAMLKQHAIDTQDKMVVVEFPAGTSVSAAKTLADSLRDTEGRVIIGFPQVLASISGVKTQVGPAAFIASMFSQTAPNEDLASVDAAGYAAAIVGLELPLSRADYIQLKDAGIAAFEIDPDLGAKLKSGVVSQILDSSKVTIYRRRMADFLTDSVARFLKNYQNAVNSAANRALVKGSIVAFVNKCVSEGLLPGDSEVKGGKASLVDTESLNTDATIAQGFFKILWKQRIYSSMRYIVLQAEIGESVVVSEQ